VRFYQHFTPEFFLQKQILQLFSNYSLDLWLIGRRITAKNVDEINPALIQTSERIFSQK